MLKKKIISVASAIMCAVSLCAGTLTVKAEESTEEKYGDYLFYKKDDYFERIDITGCDKSATEIEIPDEIDGLPVNSIDAYAFYKCENLLSVTISSSVTNISNLAFDGCTSLTTINVSDDNERYISIDGVLFSYNKYIDKNYLEIYPKGKKETKYSIPDNVYLIDDLAFRYCTSLTSIVIPSSVTEIRESAFAHCTGLTNIVIPDSVTEIGSEAFYNCTGLTSIAIPDSVTEIADYAFSNCTGLTNIELPNSITSIGKSAFKGTALLDNQNGIKYVGAWAVDCGYNMTNAEIKDGTKGIADYVFYCKSDLKSITIPNGVTSIGESAFRCCEGLTSMTIPSSVTSIGKYAFQDCECLISIKFEGEIEHFECGYPGIFSGCTSLKEIPGFEYIADTVYLSDLSDTELYNSLPDGVIYIDEVAMGHKGDIPEDTEIIIKNGCKKIKNDAFMRSNIVSVVIPDSVEKIGEKAFYWCDSLESVTIGNVGIIGKSAFGHCMDLETVTVNSEIIEENAFSYCIRLNSITIGENVKEIKSMAFTDADCTESVYIPDGTIIDGGSFSSCNSLQEYIVNDTNSHYSTIDGVLFDKSKTKLIAYPYRNSYYKNENNDEIETWIYNVPDGTKEIGSKAFWYSSGIKEIFVPESVDTIGDLAFEGCRDLYKITLPKKINDMGGGVFANCTSLKRLEVPEGVTELKSADELTWGGNIVPAEFVTGCTTLILPESLEQLDISSIRYYGYGASICNHLMIKNKNCKIVDSYNGDSYGAVYPKKIYGYENSTAENFCTENGIQFVLFEDLSNIINLKNWLIKKEIILEESSTLDINNDGKINVFDFIILKRQINS